MTELKKYISLMLVFMFVLLSLSACTPSGKTGGRKGNEVYIKVNDENLSREYIGYFFYLAQMAMLEEAGYSNSPKEDIDTYWQTAKIEGKNAVDVARDVASDNAVAAKVQYLKAVSEGITLSQEEEDAISSDIERSVNNQGGMEAFEKTLESMGTNIDAYKQIRLENVYIQKLYNKYNEEGVLYISETELAEFTLANDGLIKSEDMLEYAMNEKFNAFVNQWKKDSNIIIDDVMMKTFEVD